MRDLHSNIKAISHIIGTVTSTQTPAAGVSLVGFGSAEFVIHIGTVTNITNSPQPSWTFKLEHSDSSTTGFAAVTSANDVLVGSAKPPVTTPNSSTGVFLTVDAAAEDDAVYRIGYVGPKPYVRVVATAANTPGATPLSVVAILGHPGIAPTSDA